MLSADHEDFDKDELDYLGFTIDPLCAVPLELRKKIKKETMIFPRYHQRDCVRSLIHDAREKVRA